MTRIGVYSFAHVHTEAYIQALRQTPGIDLIGVADDDLVRGERYAADMALHLFPSSMELLAAQPEGVVICCENAYHRRAVEQALAAGIGYILKTAGNDTHRCAGDYPGSRQRPSAPDDGISGTFQPCYTRRQNAHRCREIGHNLRL